MKSVGPLLSIACIAAALALTAPARAQVYKCEGPDGRIEYSGKPCGAGQEKQLSIQGSRAASPASPAPARPPGPAQPSGGRRADHAHAVRCEEYRLRTEVLEAALPKLDDEPIGPRGRIVSRDWRREALQTYGSAVEMECRHVRWFVEQEGFTTQDCRAELAQLRRHVEYWVRNAKDAPELNDLRRKLFAMNCVAPRGSQATSAPTKPAAQARLVDGRGDKRAASEPAGLPEPPEPPERPMDLRPLGQTDAGTMFYDAASIVRAGPLVSVRVVVSPVTNPDKPSPKGRVAVSAAMDMEFDCQARRARLRGGRSHAGLGLTGEVVERMPAADWNPIDWTRREIVPGLYTVTCGAAR